LISRVMICKIASRFVEVHAEVTADDADNSIIERTNRGTRSGA